MMLLFRSIKVKALIIAFLLFPLLSGCLDILTPPPGPSFPQPSRKATGSGFTSSHYSK